MSPLAARQIGHDPAFTFGFRDLVTNLADPHGAQRNDEHSHPLEAMKHPARKELVGRWGCGSSSKSQVFPGSAFAHFPDETIVIEMEQTGRGHQPVQRPLYGVDLNFLQQCQRPVSQNKTDVEADESATPPEYEPHESADGAVFLDSVAIVDPNQGKVLNIVEHLEQCDPGKDICNAVVAVPPKCNARPKQG